MSRTRLRVARQPRRHRHGYALIAALWLMVALTALGVEITALARTRRLSVANAIESERARAAAEAGIEHARARLARRQTPAAVPAGPSGNLPSPDPWWRVETVLPDSVTLGNARYRVRLADANSRLNVNRATENELRRLFAALRIDAGKADQLAQVIADWRDADDLAHLRGAERDAYLRAGLPALPRNAPLVRVDELRDLYGMTPALFDRIAPLLTVVGSGQINLNTAERPVLLTLPGFTDETVAAVLRLRGALVQIASLEQLAAALSPGARNLLLDASGELIPRVAFETREVEVTSEGWVRGSPARARTSGLFVRGGGAVFFIGKRVE